MTTVSKLAIQGIRSFHHERAEILEFERPVTLIVGPNGSGKTTIIECLKVASAGIYPPNASKGHGFIHDPQFTGLAEVKAKVHMLFRTGGPHGKEYNAVRAFQLTNKRTKQGVKQTFKALDSTLTTLATDGSRASMSHRCADMDTEVPFRMGVSRAVLDNVIFCHQEDSSWPLQEAATVKKRFDDIFGATRYTKALQHIKELQREWAKQTRDRKADADLSQAHMDQANRLTRQKEEKQQAVEVISAELRHLDSQIASAGEASQAAELELAQHESCGVRVAELRSLLSRCARDRDEVIRSMQERGQDVYRESYDELQQQVKQFTERLMPECEQKVRMAKAAVETGERQKQAAEQEARRLREDMGETLAAAELLSSRRQELTERLARAGEPSVAAMRAKLDALAAEFSRVEREQRQRDSAAENALQAAEKLFQEASLEASKNESRAADAQGIIRRLEEEARTLVRAQPDLDALMRTMRENEAALVAEGNDGRLRRLEARQEEIGRKRLEIQYSISRKQNEVAQLEAQSDAHVEVDASRRRLREAETELGTKLGQVRTKLVPLLGGQMPEAAEAETKVMAELGQVEDKMRRLSTVVRELQQKLSSASARRSSAEADLRHLRTEESQLVAVLHGSADDFVANMDSKKREVETASKDVAMTESAKHMYEKFREKSVSKNACQFCRRAFAGSSNDLLTFQDSVDKLIAKIPAYLETSRAKLNGAQRELNELDALRPKWDRLRHVQADIARRNKEVAACAEDERAARVALEPEERESKKMEERMKQLQDLRPEAAALRRAASAVEEMQRLVRSQEARLLGGQSKVSLQAERDQLRVLQEQLSELGREEDAVRTSRDLLAKQQEQLRSQLAEQRGKLQLLQAQVARRRDVDSDLAARQAELRECNEVATRSKSAAVSAEARVKQLREERAQQVAAYRRDLDSRDAAVRTLQREVDAVTEAEKAIEVMRGRVENAEGLKARLQGADEAVRKAERELEGLKLKLESEEEKRRKREAVRENLQANLRLKSLEAECQQHQVEIERLLKELGGRDLEALRRNVEVARRATNDLRERRSFKQGALSETKEATNKLELELESPLYKGVEERHREAMIKHESAHCAAKDLGRYHQALDRALMKFHTVKMAEINKTIKDLWQRVYRGKDIDYIAIRSDTEEPEGSEGAGSEMALGRAVRSYNYRVVMVCGDAELDMRGRCSAGQRVLSSLIIRLALADSFCVNCGVLALDEPTTNLDGANIRGLAEALAALIEARRQTSRFQLILITHDEVFVNHLSQLQVCDWYYHIQKDHEGCSKIERRDFRLLGD